MKSRDIYVWKIGLYWRCTIWFTVVGDPSMKLILEYLQSGECFIYKDGSVILGCYVLKEINIDKVELVNIVK